ncbi:glycosyltransferase [Confluentibacter citreus]|uniref:glycosyltransferase n=1 Tax=Confluentibacter citreus TaxID=2007307 RepID=UPI000C28F489|nr:glycosyltransferase [Confluentibacter citreus]
MNIAIFSPSQNAYSETFIQAHKNYLKGKVFYYYGKGNFIELEGEGGLKKEASFLTKLINKVFKKPSPTYWEYIAASLKAHKVNVILIEYGSHAHHLLPLLNITKLPVIVHFHGFDASIRDIIKSCNYYKQVFLKASKVIAVSRVMERALLNLGCPIDKLVYNVYGPCKEFELVSPKYNKKQFLSVGRFTDKKAPYYAIKAFSKVINKHPDAKLLFGGDGVLLDACKSLVKQLKLENHIIFLGVITQQAYMDLLQESMAFVQHSIVAENGDSEGTPLSILEASAAGLPVISTIHAGIPDIIAHNKTGLLSEERDVEAMSAHMLKVLDDVAFAKRLGQAGKENIRTHFNMELHIEKLNKILANATQ